MCSTLSLLPLVVVGSIIVIGIVIVWCLFVLARPFCRCYLLGGGGGGGGLLVFCIVDILLIMNDCLTIFTV